jgi:hypothetical protein
MVPECKWWKAEKVVLDFSPFFGSSEEERTEVLDYFCCSMRCGALSLLSHGRAPASCQPAHLDPLRKRLRYLTRSKISDPKYAIVRSVSPAQFAKDTEICTFEGNARHSSPFSQ